MWKLLLALVVVTGCENRARFDAAEMWFDPDDGAPMLGSGIAGTPGTFWMIVRLGGVAFVCDIYPEWEGLVEVAFYGDSIGYAPNARAREQRCDVEWTESSVVGEIGDWRGGRLRVEPSNTEATPL